MTDADSQELGLLPKVVIGLAVVLIASGALWHGFTAQVFHRFWHDLVERPDGPMRFRFILQPLMAVIAAIHGGLNDARTGRSPYFWTIAGNPRERAGRLREGLNATARIILLGVIMDVIYQFLVFKTFYPAESLAIALVLAFLPYVLIRGPVTRIARWRGVGTSSVSR